TNATGVPVLQLEVSAFNEDVTVSRLGLRASGSLDDAIGLMAVRLFLDVNHDGRIDPADVEVAAPARAAGNDGAISFAPLSERVARNASAVYLVTADLS